MPNIAYYMGRLSRLYAKRRKAIAAVNMIDRQIYEIESKMSAHTRKKFLE